MARLFALAALAGCASAIYPDGHWDRVTKLTNDNFDDTVKSAVESDKTLFAPKWNEITELFADNPDVTFGDISLSDGGPRGGEGANPGAGGWPTIRYYNKETGILGKSYEKKTSMAMCSELGPEGDHYMQDYVEEAGNTSLCPVTAPYKGCSEKEVKFIEKMSTKSADEVTAQVARLTKMKGDKMTPDLAKWLNQRLKILEKLAAGGGKDEL